MLINFDGYMSHAVLCCGERCLDTAARTEDCLLSSAHNGFARMLDYRATEWLYAAFLPTFPRLSHVVLYSLGRLLRPDPSGFTPSIFAAQMLFFRGLCHVVSCMCFFW